MTSYSHRFRSVVVWISLACCFVAVGCGGQHNQRADPTARADATQATVTAQGVDLPGRLLFVRAGDIWQWQGNIGVQRTARGDLAQPSWSPDGTRIVCVQRGQSYSDIGLLANDGQFQPLTNGNSSAPPNSFERVRATTWSFYPTFAADGQSILYSGQAGPATGEPASDYNLSLFQIPSAIGGERTQVYATEEGHIGKIARSRGGDVVFAFQPTATALPRLQRYSNDAAADIAGVPEGSYDPAFSADGSWLAFAARSSGTTDISVVPAGGGTATRLTTQGAARAPAFSPDGQWLAFLALTPGTSSFDLWVVPLKLTSEGLSAGEPRALTNGLHLDPDSGIAWGA